MRNGTVTLFLFFGMFYIGGCSGCNEEEEQPSRDVTRPTFDEKAVFHSTWEGKDQLGNITVLEFRDDNFLNMAAEGSVIDGKKGYQAQGGAMFYKYQTAFHKTPHELDLILVTKFRKTGHTDVRVFGMGVFEVLPDSTINMVLDLSQNPSRPLSMADTVYNGRDIHWIKFYKADGFFEKNLNQ